MTIEETLKRAPNWDALFRLAESEEGQAVTASLDREAWARWLHALDVQENGLARGDERYQEACRTGRIEWYDARGRKVVLLRMSRAAEEAARRPDGRPHLTWPMLWEEAAKLGGQTLNKRVPADVFAALVEAAKMGEAREELAMQAGAWTFQQGDLYVRLSIAPPGGGEEAPPASLLVTPAGDPLDHADKPPFRPASEAVKDHPELLGSSKPEPAREPPGLPPIVMVPADPDPRYDIARDVQEARFGDTAKTPIVQVKKGKKK